METQDKPEHNVTQVVPFFGVTDIQASARWYMEGLGFEMTHQWTPEGKLQWCWLQLGGAALMLQEFVTEGHGGRAPEGKLGEGVSLCFMCQDALAIYHESKARGLKPSRPFVGNRMWVTSFTDPDGYHLHFESATDVPEETELPEEEL
jgi:lactoylglutathione lyase